MWFKNTIDNIENTIFLTPKNHKDKEEVLDQNPPFSLLIINFEIYFIYLF